MGAALCGSCESCSDRMEGWTTHLKVVHVRHYGDPNNKAHAFVIAFSNEEYGEKAKDFAFPPPAMSDENFFTGRDYVHNVVPKRFHRSNTADQALPERNQRPGTLQKVAQIHPGQGPAKLTYALHGLDAISPTPTTLGAGRRVPAEWKMGDGFQETIMWTPEEAMKAKSFCPRFS